ncbi:MAG: META domain-containing protein [Rikenellaceae bacterium]
MRKILFLSLLALALASCCACSIKTRHDSRPLLDSKWVLIQKDGLAVTTNDNYNFVVTVDGKLAGKGDCNQIMGEYVLSDKNKIKFSSMAASRMMCPNAKAEAEFLALFERADNYALDVRLLMLFEGNDLLAIFEAK